MQNYKLSVSKNWKKYTIVFKAETEKLARERVHKEWYSILSIEEIREKSELWNTFIFNAFTSDWEQKNWKIVWEDIFKVYVKLRKNLEYDVKLLFSENDRDLELEKKEKIIKNLEDEYNIFYSKSKEVKEDKIREKIRKQKEENRKDESFYLKKELDQTYKLLDHVLLKLENLISEKNNIKINIETKEKIKNIYNSIIVLKKSTNLSKLKEVWELALIKIWKIELEELEKKHDKNSNDLLKETNFLLKKIGSKEVFIEKNKDISYIFSKFLKEIKESFWKINSKKEKKEEIDKDSHSYIKNLLFLKKYKQKLKENNIYILKNIFKVLINKEFRENLLLKRKILQQNITLFKAKEKWVWFSYTSVKKWFTKLVDYILRLIKLFKDYLFIVIFIYSIIYIFYLNTIYYLGLNETNFKWLFYFIVVFFTYIILFSTRNLFLIILNFVILFFIVIFWVVNF